MQEIVIVLLFFLCVIIITVAADDTKQHLTGILAVLTKLDGSDGGQLNVSEHPPPVASAVQVLHSGAVMEMAVGRFCHNKHCLLFQISFP